MLWYYAALEFYISLVSYTVIHQIFVIASDFVDALNIPPLNIGIYVDKLASIRALLMAAADIIEWAITQEMLHDPGAFKRLEEPSPRRVGSVLSFFGMWICRSYYLWIIYKSDNKSLVAFVTLSVEGFWFGVFQMGFFAIGPEYNAFTSLAIHTMGNIIFFFQLIMESMAETHPHINCLYKVRVHGWISVITTTLALPLWLFFCHDYIQGQSDEFQALVGDLKNIEVSNAEGIANKLAEKMQEGGGQNTKQKVINLVKKEFGLTVTNVTGGSGNVTVTISGKGSGSGNSGPIRVKVAGGSGEGEFEALVKALAPNVRDNLQGDLGTAEEIAGKLKEALDAVQGKIMELVKSMVDPAQKERVSTVSVETSSTTVEVKVNGETGNPGQASVQIQGNSQAETITIKVQGQTVVDQNKCKAIANSLVLALVSDEVRRASGDNIQQLGTGTEIQIEVNNAKSDSQAKRIAYKLGSALCHDSVKKRTGALGMFQNKIDGTWTNVLSPLLLFPVGSFPEDFLCPGILPFAFLDPERANLVNYAMPVFFMAGAVVVVLLNDFFQPTGFAKGTGLDSWFKDWSENEENGKYYHAMWLFNIPKFAAFFISIWAIHGIYPSLRAIVQSRWRVMLLTFNVIVPRSTLEVMGYVGVANYAISAGDTGDFNGFKIIAWHDVLAMSCRFIFGKLAVGYNWTRVSLGHDFQRDSVNFHDFQTCKHCLSVKNPFSSIFEHDQNFVNFSDFLDRLPNFEISPKTGFKISVFFNLHTKSGLSLVYTPV